MFIRDKSGSSAALFAAALVPALGMIGAAIDYSRSSHAKSALQTATDAGTLAYALSKGDTAEKKLGEARSVFSANLASLGVKLGNPLLQVQVNGSAIVGNASADHPNVFMPILGRSTQPIAAKAELRTQTQGQLSGEIALVVDTTGSMRDDMPALRSTLTTFVDSTLASASGTRIAIVPFVGAVNVGASFPMTYVDQLAQSPWHGRFFRTDPWQSIAERPNCYVGSGPTPSYSTGSGSSWDKVEVFDPRRSFARLTTELFGISVAHAQGVPIPPGFLFAPGCWLHNPPQVNHLVLFNKIPNTRWKGCVEARPDPFDVNDTPPLGSDPRTLFVPYFWPDEADNLPSEPITMNNDYMDDRKSPPAFFYRTPSDRMGSVYKYDGTPAERIKETPPDTRGPNKACPDPMVRLTSNAATLKNAIAALSYWEGSGTVSSEGVMWGWRALSPNAPFADGSAYGGGTPKHLILFSDGLNNQLANGPSTFDPAGYYPASDYSAYGYLYRGRVEPATFAAQTKFLNSRMELACQNAKKAGITVHTVLYRESDPEAVRLMKECATAPEKAFTAANANELRIAFEKIGGAVSTTLRLTR